MNSGLLDIERRLEDAALESMRAWEPALGVVAVGNIRRRQDASSAAGYPALVVQAYNMTEYPERSGNYLGGLRWIAVSYADDDKDRVVAERVLGAARSWSQQENVAALITATASAGTFGSLLTVIDLANDGAAYWDERDERRNADVLELTVVCRPSR